MATLKECKQSEVNISDLIDFISYATDDEVSIICEAGKDAWLHDE